MRATLFLSTTRPGVTRAERRADGSWSVEAVLPDVDVRCFAADPHQSGVVWAGTQGAGLLRSEDQGKTWRPAGLDGQIVKSLAISPTEPDRMFAGLKPPLVYESRDGGATWTDQEAFRRIPSRPFWRSPSEPPGTAYVQALAISPGSSDTLLAGIGFGALVRTIDGGQQWFGHRKGAVRDCHTLTFHATDGRYAYAGGGDLGGAISKDAGETWTLPKGLDRHYGWAVAADPANPEIWYLSAGPGPRRAHSEQGIADAYIFRSRGGGAWEKLGGGLPQPLRYMPYALLTDPGAPGHLYAGLRSGEIWFSANHGDHWGLLPVNMGSIHYTLQMWT